MIKLGVNTVLYKPFSLREAVENLAAIGYDGFEISAIKGMCEHLDLENWKDQKNEIKELCEEFNMEILASEVASSDPNRLRLAFEAAKEIGIPVINIGPIGKSNVPEDVELCINTMDSLAKIAEEYQVNLCMKAHVGAAVYNSDTTMQLIQRVQNPYFGIDMDPSHIFRAGEAPEDALPQVLPYMKHIHIRDCPHRLQNPGLPLQQTCGTGLINLRGYLSQMAAGNYSGPVDLEVIGPDMTLAQCNIVAAESYGYLNGILQSLGAREHNQKNK